MGNRANLQTPNSQQFVVYSDITENLLTNPLTGQLAIVTNEQDVLNSLRRIVLMGQYDVEYEDYGGDIEKLLFEPLDSTTALAIQTKLEEACRKETRANIQSINVNEYAEYDSYIITIVFTVINNPQPIQFQHILKRIR